jgi:hypothetical protein
VNASNLLRTTTPTPTPTPTPKVDTLAAPEATTSECDAWRLTGIAYSNIKETRRTGGSWDTLGGKPDPFFAISVNGRTTRTVPTRNSLQASASLNIKPIKRDQVVSVTLWDKDVSRHDRIAEASGPFRPQSNTRWDLQRFALSLECMP